MSLVKKWGAAICTGFYFLRSNRRTVKIFRQTRLLIHRKRQKQPKWQASDQWAINHAVDDQEVQLLLVLALQQALRGVGQSPLLVARPLHRYERTTKQCTRPCYPSQSD